ncbi:hypothetical protein [Streptomyces sp. NPDC058108]|uniref:hypothetical protein n=1 Tax=Streptomyces sp. NPDC058108 TaxID=3346344 RepID=UPI0036EE110E
MLTTYLKQLKEQQGEPNGCQTMLAPSSSRIGGRVMQLLVMDSRLLLSFEVISL